MVGFKHYIEIDPMSIPLQLIEQLNGDTARYMLTMIFINIHSN